MDFFLGEVVVNIVRKGENAIFTKMLSKVIVHVKKVKTGFYCQRL